MSTPSAATIVVRPAASDAVLVNPGIGFMTFQRFNGDRLNEGKKWTEGYPIEYQPFAGNTANVGYPATSLAYFRIYWKFIEPEPGAYRWDLLDTALATAAARGQTLLLRVAPYGTAADNDVPEWYRAMLGPESSPQVDKWRTDPEDPRYPARFGGMIRALGARYDGHPALESVDTAIVGAWGEGAGSELLSEGVRRALVDAYLDAFPTTPLLMLLTDPATNGYALSRRDVGWRVDCLGDMGGFSPTWCHMLDLYPQSIIRCGMAAAWQRAPVSLEVCWVMQHWQDMGWDVDYIIDESLKWHISSFNGKSSAVPSAWWPNVERWLKRMGYRFVLRRFAFPSWVVRGQPLAFESWWENRGVAPCYRRFRLALRLAVPGAGPDAAAGAGRGDATILPVDADVRTWLPGDNLCDGHVTVPAQLAPGDYELAVGLVGERDLKPAVQLAIESTAAGGWYPMGRIEVRGAAG